MLVEVKEKDHWWDEGSKDYMLHLLDVHDSQYSDDSFGIYKVSGSITVNGIDLRS